MDNEELLVKIAAKDLNIDEFVKTVLDEENLRKEIVKQLLTNNDIMIYYHCYYVIDKASEMRPDLFYKYWYDFTSLLSHKNSYHRDIGMTIIANLTKADEQNLFAKIYKDYMKHINDEKFMTARCFIRNIKKILKNKNEFKDLILEFLVDVDHQCTYPEKQKALLKSDIIEVFDEIYPYIDEKKQIDSFIKAEVNNISPKTNKKVKDFIKRHGLKFA